MDRQSWLRAKGGKRDGRVTFAELFFDLIFVFTIIQLSHTLAAHFSPLGFVEALILMLAIWWLWMFTTWALNWLDPETMPVRLLLFAMMFGGLILAAAIPEAWGDRGAWFGILFALLQVSKNLFTAIAFVGTSRPHVLNHARIAGWLAVSGLFWIAGGFVGHELRMVLWLVALAIEYASPALRFWVPVYGPSDTRAWDISGAHMAERCALFIIICIGETILVSGRTLSEHGFTAENLATFAAVFTTTCMLWWIYFRFGHSRISHIVEDAAVEHSERAGLLGRSIFTYGHIPIVVGIILTAVGAEFALAHPMDPASMKEAAAILGGPAVFLAGNIWIKGMTSGRPPLSHLAGLALFAAVALAAGLLTPALLSVAAAGVLALVAIWEFVSLTRRPRRRQLPIG
jgi:low temperature requirement protein LtrA